MRAPEASIAQTVATEADEAYDCLAKFKARSNATRFEIWLTYEDKPSPRPPWYEPDAFADRAEGRIILLNEPAPDSRRVIVSHELAHLLHGDAMAYLPYMVREGLCDWMAVHCVPDAAVLIAARVLGASRARNDTHFVLTFTSPDGGTRESITLSGDDPPQNIETLLNLGASKENAASTTLDILGRGLGFVLVCNLLKDGDASILLAPGTDDAIRTGSSLSQWYAQRAQLSSSPEWASATASLVATPRIIEAMLLHDLDRMAAAIAGAAQQRCRHLSASEFESGDPRIRWLYSESELSLIASAEVRDAIRSAWLKTGQ